MFWEYRRVDALLGIVKTKSAIIAFHGLGQKVTQRTAQQCSPQIRVVVTGCHIVDADHDDRVQDDDLTKEHDFSLVTVGNEDGTTSSSLTLNMSSSSYLTISVRQAEFPAARCVTLQYDRPNLRRWLHSPFQSLLLIIIHYVEPLVIYDCYGE